MLLYDFQLHRQLTQIVVTSASTLAASTHFAKLNRHTAADQELTQVQTKTQATLVLDYDSLVLELGQ